MLIMVKRSITKKTKSSYVCLKSFVAKSFRSRKDRTGQEDIVPSSSSSKEQRRGGRGSLVPHCGGRHILRCSADLQLYILATLQIHNRTFSLLRRSTTVHSLCSADPQSYILSALQIYNCTFSLLCRSTIVHSLCSKQLCSIFSVILPCWRRCTFTLSIHS